MPTFLTQDGQVTFTQRNALSKLTQQWRKAPAVKGKTKYQFSGGRCNGVKTETGPDAL